MSRGATSPVVLVYPAGLHTGAEAVLVKCRHGVIALVLISPLIRIGIVTISGKVSSTMVNMDMIIGFLTTVRLESESNLKTLCCKCLAKDSAPHVKRNQDDGRIPIYDASQLGDLPPAIQHMSCYAKHASSRFKPYQPGKHVPTALEHRFMTKNVLKHHEADMSLVDVQQGKEILRGGLAHVSNATLRSAVIAKRADAETWDLKSTERHAILLQIILRDNAEQYLDSLADACFFESIMVKCTHQQLEDDADFTIAAYSHDLMTHSITDKQLDHLEEISAERNVSCEDGGDTDSEGVGNRFNHYLDSILGGTNSMVAVA
ncbi:hypothetical protein EV702DRAFT_1044593 [Suillus placidus]|uniref:Uncharacterized protein n=1 Tax=Suillus placidus TaxID=48579 RepID=A0A9P6ZWX0_9AGAM|nr:hypothetical protein EV702DRAFT_1044593 [Suillus placidus]